MKILVAIGHVPDTTTKVRFDNNELSTDNIQWIINPWDELALTRALELKEGGAGIDKISVVNVGGKNTEPTIRKALAIGADDAYRVDAEAKDAFFVAKQVAELAKSEGYDIVITGLENADFNGNVVGGMVAEMMDVAAVSAVSALNIEGGAVKLDREIDGGKQTMTTTTPVVLTVQKGIAIDPRIPAMRGIMMARKKPLKVLPAVEVEAMTEVVEYIMPEAKGACKMIDADNVAELVDLLRNEAKVL